MILLSAAIRKGSPPEPLHAAFVGSLTEFEAGRFASQEASMSHDALCSLRVKGLHHAFPDLGRTVRAYPTLAKVLEAENILPRIRPWQLKYRQEIHLSLWGAIAALYKRRSKDQIADVLASTGL